MMSLSRIEVSLKIEEDEEWKVLAHISGPTLALVCSSIANRLNRLEKDEHIDDYARRAIWEELSEVAHLIESIP